MKQMGRDPVGSIVRLVIALVILVWVINWLIAIITPILWFIALVAGVSLAVYAFRRIDKGRNGYRDGHPRW